MKTFLKNLLHGEEGAAMVEYALMVALIAAALVVAVPTLTTAVSGAFSTAASSINPTAS